MFALVRIDGLSGYAHVDTGAVRSMIPKSLAANFESVGRGSIEGAIGKSKIKKLRARQLDFLGTKFTDLLLNTYPGESQKRAIGSLSVIMTAGVDVLFRAPLSLDFNRKKIQYLPSLKDSRSHGVARLWSIRRLPFFQLSLGTRKLTTLFDTGSGYSVLNSRHLKALNPEIRSEGPRETHDPTGGAQVHPTFSHPRLMISGTNLGRNTFLAMDLSGIERLLGSSLDFILGFNKIESHNWIIDEKRRELTVF